MKKMICFLLALSLTIGLCACGGGKETEAPTTAAPTEAPTTAAPTEAPTEKATEAPTEPVTEAPTEAPTETEAENPVDMDHVPDKHTKVTEETLIGNWEITGWINDYLGDGSFSPVENQQFIYDGEKLDYVIAGELSSSRPYVLEHEYNVVIEGDLIWTSYFNEDGALCQYDPRYGITYVCTLNEEVPEHVPENHTKVTEETLIGNWEITGWINDYLGDGSFSPVENQQFIYDGEKLDYVIAGELSSSRAYVLEGSYNVVIENDLVWTSYFNEDGALCQYDPRYGITYVCTLNEEVPEHVPENHTKVTEETLIGSWEITGWINDYLGDGSFSPVENQQFIYDGEKLDYVIAGELSSSRAYVLEGSYNVVIENDLVWTSYFNEDGALCQYDPRYGITYVCVASEAD